jgi:predicted DNA-binding protein with PD1-like motif
MQSAIESNVILVKLEHDEDLFEELRNVVREYKIESAIILSGIGQLRDFELLYFTGEKYINKIFKKAHELLSMQGSIARDEGNAARDEGNASIHIHASLANERCEVMGGHLYCGTVTVLNEITLLKLDNIHLTRELNKKTGLKELQIK